MPSPATRHDETSGLGRNLRPEWIRFARQARKGTELCKCIMTCAVASSNVEPPQALGVARDARAEPPAGQHSIVQHRCDRAARRDAHHERARLRTGALRSSRSFDKTRMNWAALCLCLRVKTLQLTVWNSATNHPSRFGPCRMSKLWASASIESRASRVFPRELSPLTRAQALTSCNELPCVFFREACCGSSSRALPAVHPRSWTRASFRDPMTPATPTRRSAAPLAPVWAGSPPWLRVDVPVPGAAALAMRPKVGRCRSARAARA